MSMEEKLIIKSESPEEIKAEFNSSEILRSILGEAPFAVNIWTEEMTNIMCNSHILKAFNINSGEDFLDKFYEFSPELQPNGISSVEMARRNFSKVIKNGKHVFNWMHITPDGNRLPCEITLIKLEGASSEPYIAGFIKDLRAEFTYAKHEEKYDYYFTDKLPRNILMEEIYELSKEWFFSVDLRTGNYNYFGRKGIQGLNENTMIRDSEILERGLIHEDDVTLYEKMMENIKVGITESYDIRFLDNEGFYRYHKVTCKLISDSKNEPVFVVGKGIDIHEQKVFEERSQKDLLTDCYNKISAQNIIAEKLISNSTSSHAFFIVDIDNFKSVNDNLGHYFGDEVIRDISTGLKSVFRDNDTVARIGGDEFIIFVEDLSDLNVIGKKAEKILDVYRKTYSGEYKDYSISGSVGIAQYPRDGATYDELYQKADKALSQAKIRGKNRFEMYSEDFNIGTTRSITKIENANRIASSFFDYDLISAVFNILYEKDGNSDAINLTLSYICQKYNADRSYIFESLDGGLSLDNTFEYCKEGISSEINNLQGIPYELFKDFLGKAHNGIIYSNNLRETLEQDRAFEIMDDQGILSFVHAQTKRDGKMTFFIGLDDCTKTRIWTEKEINSLQYIGKLLSIILQGTHLRNKINQLAVSNRNSASILDTSDSIVYVSDLKTYDLLYLNKIGKDAVGVEADSDLSGQKCYKILQGKEEPCEFCTNHLLKEDEYYEWSYYNPNLDGTFLLKDKLIDFGGRAARLEIATDVSKIVELEKTLTHRLADEQFLMECTEMLHSGKEPDKSISSLLNAVVNYYDAERSYIFELSECGNYISNTYECCKEGCEEYKESLQNIPVEELKKLMNQCETQIAFRLNIDEVDKNTLEYKLMEMQKLKEVIIGAIKVEGKNVTGFVGVDNPGKNKEKIVITKTVAKFTANFLDETELVSNLNRLSYYDTLTRIKNRYSYTLALKRIDMNIGSLGVIYADIIGLCEINDTKGVMAGDSALIKLAEILRGIFEENVFRVGGDEFAVISENISETDFEKKIELLKAKLDKEESFRTSIGYTWNKNQKSSNIIDLQEGKEYEHILLRNLEKEISDGKYIVYMQPQVNLSSGKVESAEALVRRLGADEVVQSPFYFLPFYEKEGMVPKIDEFVFETVCKTLKNWKDSGVDALPRISVNCSRITISEKGIVEKFSSICDKYGVDRAKLIIEITETIRGIEEKAFAKVIENFSDAGFLVSLDDFGSGYSNLNSLVVSDFDEVKIDMKIISGMHKDKKSKALSQIAISLCENLGGVASVAEGVEEKVQHEMLCEMGCRVGQGYYYGKPMPVDEFTNRYLNL